ncbi:hypothetical protein FB45DRAFT_786017 [Roridomyces roridus]|uniref:NAD(P)-binding protein n=1 Tax=Roridomyces roridus TaxID=1738132 RepID=A0AAD7FTA2_9AGAR|nr:hypothetical protein FB45DRAFT_786017 [Roridomyces roridus]
MVSTGVALVTGAAQGIGKAIALRLADDGFDVAVNDIVANEKKLSSVVEEIKAKGRQSSAHLADVSVEEDVKGMVAEVVRVYGGLNVMVANAGVCKCALMTETSVEDYDRVMNINARGTFLCYKHAGVQMMAQGRGGRIIGACSASGKRAGSAFTSAYVASKFAIRGLTQSAALEFGPHKITVNAYAPGPIDTDMLDYIKTSHGSAVPAHWQTAGTTGDIAALVSYIASKESGFITGQSLSINGGIYFD